MAVYSYMNRDFGEMVDILVANSCRIDLWMCGCLGSQWRLFDGYNKDDWQLEL